MKKFIYKMIILSLVFGGIVNAKQNDNISIKFYPQNTKGKEFNPVLLSFNGRIYKDSLFFKELIASKQKLTDIEKYMIDTVNINANGSQDELIKRWNPSERAEMKKLIMDKKMYESNKIFYSNIVKSRFIARIEYGAFTLFYLEHILPKEGIRVKLYPSIKGKDAIYYDTNALQGDPFYDLFAFRLEKYFQEKLKNMPKN